MLSKYIVSEARTTDLLITGVASGALLDGSRRVNSGDLVMKVGRPVLIVPAAADKLKLELIVVAWKDTREARRATLDALPSLKQAADVAVVEIAAEEELADVRTRVDDVVAWLKRRSVVAKPIALPSIYDDAGRRNATPSNSGLTSSSLAPMATAACANGYSAA